MNGHTFYVIQDFTPEELRSNEVALKVMHGQKICKLCGLSDMHPCPRTPMTLKSMMDCIEAQQKLRGIVFDLMTPEAKIKYASEAGHALFVEVAELVSSWPFASWKTTPTDVDNIKREIIDCFFFLTIIARCFGIDARALQSWFSWVLNNNAERIESGEHKEVANGL